MAKALKGNTDLLRLKLAHNEIGPEGAIALAGDATSDVMMLCSVEAAAPFLFVMLKCVQC